MNYAQLCTNIQDICENEFSADQLAMFTQQAEQKIYNTVQIPALRKVHTDTTTADVPTIDLPADYLYTFSFSIVDGSGKSVFLLNKDFNFIREAYPDPTDTGVPKHYANLDADTLLLGPTPDDTYAVEHVYGHYPESIVVSGSTWLGDAFDAALLNGALVEAIRFMKGEQDMVAMYENLYVTAMKMLKNLGDAKLRQDTYRSGQVRLPAQ